MSVIHSTMKRVGRAAEFLAWTAFFAFAALVLAMRFWLLPDIERYRDRIVEAVSRSVGQPVRVGGIEAGWLGLNPRIHLRDVRLYDAEGREALVLPAVENVLSWSSLVRGRLKVHALAVEGLRLQVRRDAEGALYVAGQKLGDDTAFSDWALAQDEIVLRNAEIEWHDELRGAPPLVLSGLNLRLRNTGDAHSLGLTARPPAQLGSSVELRALLEGDSLAELAAWKGRVYAELGYTDLAAWRAWVDYPWVNYPLQIDQGQGAMRAWLTLEGGEVRQATADLAFTGVAARVGKDARPLRLASIQGRLQGISEGARYELAGRGLAFALEGGPSIPPTDFELAWSTGDEPQGAFSAAALDLEPLGKLAASLPVSEAWRQRLLEARPRGRLTELHFEWKENPESFSARGKLGGLAMEASGPLPGFANITGSFDATEAGGRLVLATTKGELQLPQVFPQPRIALDFLNGMVEIERHGEAGFALRLPSLNFSNAHFSGNLHGSYLYSGDGPGGVDLSAQFNRANAAHLARYLPHARLMGGDKARDWLVRSIVAGQSQDVRLRLRGDLREFPFSDPLRGQFNVTVRFEKGVLDYAEGWPRIEDAQGELVFDRDRMSVAARSGSTQGVALANVQVSMALRNAEVPLAIAGQAEGDSGAFLKYIQASPVRRMIGGATDAMSASGAGKLRLKLDVPLRDTSKTRVAGEYEFAGNRVVVHPQVPPIEAVAGRLAFSGSTLTVSDVQGRVFGGAVAVSGGSRPDGSTRIVAKGDATVAATQPLLDPRWRGYFSGASSYVATVSVAKGRSHVTVETPLQGVASTLPAPLGKSAQETLPLRLELHADERITVKLGRVVAADLFRRRQGDAVIVQRAGVALGAAADAPVRVAERSGTLVYGALPALDLDKWLPVFAGPGTSAETTHFDLRLGVLDVYGKRLHDAAVRGLADAAGWSAAVKAQELAGDLGYSKAGGGRLAARLTHFTTPEDYPGAAPRGNTEPKELPAIDLMAERFTWRGRQLGRVELAGQRAGEDWRIEKLTMTNAEATLVANGAWRGGTPSRSSLEFELNATDAGQFLGRVGYPDLVKGGRARLNGNLAWNGEPGSLDYPSLSGQLQLNAQGGQFLEIEPGLGKLISLMSLQALPRRITLDFRDVFSKGFEFERINSSAQIQAGAMTVEEFRMRGSAAQVDMRGEVDLAKETQNLRVRVIPSLGDSASTVIALVNPLLAIPAAIAQKVLKDPLGHIFAFDYSVTGGWSDPKVARLGVEARPADPQQQGAQ